MTSLTTVRWHVQSLTSKRLLVVGISSFKDIQILYTQRFSVTKCQIVGRRGAHCTSIWSSWSWQVPSGQPCSWRDKNLICNCQSHDGQKATKRHSHSADYDDDTMAMFVFGGCTTFNDLWKLDLTSRTWHRPLAGGTPTTPTWSTPGYSSRTMRRPTPVMSLLFLGCGYVVINRRHDSSIAGVQITVQKIRQGQDSLI